jgi:hypothetical protein
MEEKNFHKKSEALDYIITEYEARKRTDHLDEVAERVIWKLKRERDF